MERILRVIDFATNLLREPIMSPFVDAHAKVENGETTGKYSLAIPGYGKEDLQLKKHRNKLTIFLKNKPVKSIYLAEGIDKESIEATVERGVLNIVFHKETLEDGGDNIDIN